MKTKLVFLGIVATLISCSTESSDSEATKDYFPLKISNFWTYKVIGTNVDGTDSLYISNDTIINLKSYKKFRVKNWPLGFFSNSLNNNAVRKDGDRILLTGTAGMQFGATLPIDIVLDDFVVFKQNASENQLLDNLTGVLEQDFEGIPVTINYTLKSIAAETLPEFASADGNNYTDVKSVKTLLVLKISAVYEIIPGFSQNILILDTQEVMTSTQYFAKDIGVVYASTTIQYALEQFPVDPGLPFPETYNENHKEYLKTHTVD